MIDIKPKKAFSLIITLMVVASLGLSLVGGVGVQSADLGTSLVAQDSVETQAEGGAIEICSSDDEASESLEQLLNNLLNFIIYGGTIGAFVLAVWTKAQEEFNSGSSNQSDWTDPIKGVFLLYVVIYGGGIAMNMIFGIDVTCALPGFPGS